MTTLPNFPQDNQHTLVDRNKLYDCVPTSFADIATYITGQAYSGDTIKDAVYGASYAGNQDPHQYTQYMQSIGVHLEFVDQGDLISAIHSSIQAGNPVLVNITDQYSHDPNETHAVVVYSEDQGILEYTDPFTGSSLTVSDSWMQENLKYGYIVIASKEKIVMPLPAGYTDDGNALANNGQSVVGDYRTFLVENDYAELETLGEMLTSVVEQNPLEYGNTALGAGQAVYFQKGVIEKAYNPDPSTSVAANVVIRQWSGQEVLALRKVIDAQNEKPVEAPVEAPATPVTPTPPSIPLSQEQQLAQAAADIAAVEQEEQSNVVSFPGTEQPSSS